MESLIILALLPLAVSFPSLPIGYQQSYAVTGVLLCNGVPSVNTRVKLYDDDTGPDLDDLMDENITDTKGHFYLTGSETEFLTIDPKLNVYHDCNEANISKERHFETDCLKRFEIFLPKELVTYGNIPQNTYDVGTLKLEQKFEGESYHCMY
ncbi:hypothetical protein QR680_000210 [Steinernema hermaphroditum]|uniref:Uncharacterized protein n=1 Tax=Steinernema hermaphroditum TaxID=289476 RepID=A0AA39GUP3_9BILA|nr:hypothetical protein QR680_000210 [Steinernema hermaphroditum]